LLFISCFISFCRWLLALNPSYQSIASTVELHHSSIVNHQSFTAFRHSLAAKCQEPIANQSPIINHQSSNLSAYWRDQQSSTCPPTGVIDNPKVHHLSCIYSLFTIHHSQFSIPHSNFQFLISDFQFLISELRIRHSNPFINRQSTIFNRQSKGHQSSIDNLPSSFISSLLPAANRLSPFVIRQMAIAISQKRAALRYIHHSSIANQQSKGSPFRIPKPEF